MPRPGGRDIGDFSRHIIREFALVDNPPQIINPTSEFSKYLQSNLEIGPIESTEFAEKNKQNLINQIRGLVNEWTKLGIKMPVAIVQDSVITWKHARFQELTDSKPIPDHFPQILSNLRGCNETELLGYIACYLFCIGCTRIYITDQSHDGGIDLIGSFGVGNLAQVGVFVQAKSSEGTSTKKETLLSEFAKYLLLRRMDRWEEYLKCLDLHNSLSGTSPIYLFVSNAEFSEGIRTSANKLEAGLRTGKQIAATISDCMTATQLQTALQSLAPFRANLERNLAPKIHKAQSL